MAARGHLSSDLHGRLFATAGGAGFIECLFDRLAGCTRALLNPANQFLGLAFGKLEIVVRKLGPFLFQLAFGNVPVAFDFECVHNGEYCFVCLLFAVNATAKGNGVVFGHLIFVGLLVKGSRVSEATGPPQR